MAQIDAIAASRAFYGPVVDRESFDLAMRTGELVIGRILLGPEGRNLGIPLRMPVHNEDGTVKYVVTVVLKPDAFADVLRAQRLPEGWVVNLVDRAHNIIARMPPMPAGQPASDSFREALQRSPQGWFRGRTLEGHDMYTPYFTSSQSGWSLGIAMPTHAVDAAAWRSLWLLLVMLVLASSIAAPPTAGVALAWIWLSPGGATAPNLPATERTQSLRPLFS